MTNHKKYFPLFIDITGQKALIIGGGTVAERRVKVLAAFGADVTVISPEVTEYIENAASSNIIHLLKREYEDGDIASAGPVLVIAATNNRDVNSRVTTEAKRLNIHISAADSRGDCTFYFPAIAENGDYVAGIVSKDGGNHAGVKLLAKKIREVING